MREKEGSGNKSAEIAAGIKLFSISALNNFQKGLDEGKAKQSKARLGAK